MPEPLPGPDPRLAWVWTKDAWRKARIVGIGSVAHFGQWGPGRWLVVHTFDGAHYGLLHSRFVREVPEGHPWTPEPGEPPEGVVVDPPGFLGHDGS